VLIGPYQECPGTTRRVKDFIILISQAKLKDDIYHIRIGEILAEIVSLILVNKPFEDWPNNVAKLGEVILLQNIHQLPYFFDYIFHIGESDGINEICSVNSLTVYLL